VFADLPVQWNRALKVDIQPISLVVIVGIRGIFNILCDSMEVKSRSDETKRSR
jgi:hypothetical protein